MPQTKKSTANKALLDKGYVKRKTIGFQFSDKHKAYIRECQYCTFNIAEGAVRAGKTVDNIYAFAHELKTTPDRIHLATGSTMANAKLNIGDCNGLGLEWIFRGQCRWGEYKGNDCLYICGPSTRYRTRIVIFAGGAFSDSFKKIRGNSYGMWIATEINLHHDTTIKEAFNRQLAAKRRKVFWDLNPDHPRAPIYEEYIDKYKKLDDEGTLLGGYNYQHFTIFDNVNISDQRKAEIVSQYDEGSIWYLRDILGRRAVAEGLCYPKLATSITAKDDAFFISKADAMKMTSKFVELNIGVDFGGNGSGHAFVASAITENFEELIVLRSRLYTEGERDEDTGKRLADIDPTKLAELFVGFVRVILRDYGMISRVYCDSAESVLIRGLRAALAAEGLGFVKVENASKTAIVGRIRTANMLAAQGRIKRTEDCKTWENAITMAAWNPKVNEMERLDNGTSDIDTLDAFEYTFEKRINRLVKM